MESGNIVIGKSGNANCPFEVRWVANGERKRKRFAKKVDAELFAEELRSEIILPPAYRFTPDERAALSAIKSLCACAGVPLTYAVDIVRAGIRARSVAGCKWSDAEKRRARSVPSKYSGTSAGSAYSRNTTRGLRTLFPPKNILQFCRKKRRVAPPFEKFLFF